MTYANKVRLGAYSARTRAQGLFLTEVSFTMSDMVFSPNLKEMLGTFKSLRENMFQVACSAAVRCVCCAQRLRTGVL